MTLNKEAISAGGVIVRGSTTSFEVLLMRDRRYTAWTLPKGHVEEGETIQEAALREVAEEAGITYASIIAELGSFRRYVPKASEWKTIYYFLMTTEKAQPMAIPESIYTQTAWHPIDKLPEMFLPEQEKVIKENIQYIKKSLTCE